jgi:hypothetical protein
MKIQREERKKLKEGTISVDDWRKNFKLVSDFNQMRIIYYYN